MGTMEVISLDDTADTSLFIIDEAPIMEETTKGRKRKATGKKKNWKKSKTSQNENEPKRGHVVMGGVVPDDQTVKPRKANSLETIVIDDDESVIELSDDEVGVIGGELSASFERAQQQLNPFQVRPSNVINHRKQDKGAIERKKRVPEVKEQLPTTISSPKKSGSNVDSKAASVKRKLRPIVIDGSNIAFGHGDSRRQFSSRGIEICANYFLSKGHTVKAFVPQFRRRHNATLDTHILDKLEENKIIVYTPSRHVNGKTVVSYDDRMMVEYAAQCGGVIVTRDNLRDLASENEVFKQVIAERVLMFTWVDEEVILFPQDPLGRNGPTLDEFLSFPPEETDKTEGETSSDKPKNPV